jgi:hypothetical protein
MLKKVAIVGAVGLLTAAVLTQTRLGHVATGWLDRAERHLESKIKPEDEIRRIKKEVSGLDKEIENARRSLAEETVEARLLTKKVDEIRVAKEGSRKAVEARRVLFGADEKFVKWDNKTIPVAAAKDLLAREIASHKALEQEYKSHVTMLDIRERSRSLAQDHVQALVAQKAEIEEAVTALEADIKLAKIEQVESKYQNDGSKLAQVKNDLTELRKRIEIQREYLAQSRKYTKDSVENKSVEEIFAELDSNVGAQVGKK